MTSRHGRSRNITAVVVAFVTLLALLTVPVAAQQVIRMGTSFGPGHAYFEALKVAVAEFEARYPEYRVEIEGSYSRSKLRVASSAGVQPDVIVHGVGVIIPDALAGLFAPLNKYIEEYGIVLEEEFFPGTLPLLEWEGQVYALHWMADINFAFFRNNEILSEAGVDASTDIQYISQINEIVPKVTKVGPDGVLSQAGILPWVAGDVSNGLLTWGLAFGGSFWDPVEKRYTNELPRNIETLEWFASFREQGWWTPGTPSSLMSRQVAMGLVWPQFAGDIRKNHPDLDFSLGPIPHREDGGNPNPVWAAGPTLSITPGASDPDAAFKLINFLVRDPEGSNIVPRLANGFPANNTVPYLQELAADPEWRPFFNQSLAANYSRPPTPNVDTWILATRAATTQVVNGQIDPVRAMAQVQHEVTVDLEQTLADLLHQQQ